MKGKNNKEKTSLNSSNSWIKLHRKFLQWEWYDDINTKVLFLHLLLKANYVDKKWRGVVIKRGQHLTGRFSLSKETGLSQQQIRTSLDKLISTNEITKQSTSQYTIITINNYEKYQGVTNEITNEQPTSNQRVTTPIERKERVERIESTGKTKFSSISLLKEKELWEDLGKQFGLSTKYVQGECEKMEDWLKAKGKRQKDYKAFARNWLRRAVESGGEFKDNARKHENHWKEVKSREREQYLTEGADGELVPLKELLSSYKSDLKK